MFRALFFVAVVGAMAWGALWLEGLPGVVSIEWPGFRLDRAPVGRLIIGVAAIAILTALGYRMWRALRRAPANLSGAWRQRRRQQGYTALTRGMVSVAAGDGDEARRQVKRAEVLLNEPPLTLLLAAQTAQLNGDEQAAEKFFTAMTEQTETEFLGLRGLLTQAIKQGDREEALALARRAYRLRPKSKWVASNLFDMQVQSRQWLDAQLTCDDITKTGGASKDEARHRKAVLAVELARDAAAKDDRTEELAQLRKAVGFDPGFIPAVAGLAERLAAKGKSRKAAGMVEKAWKSSPHPDLVAPYVSASGSTDSLGTVKTVAALARFNPDHTESHLAQARAALDAQLWGEARKFLDQATAAAGGVEARICRLMAELETVGNEDLAAAHDWLTRAQTAEPDPAWVCGACGNAVPEWSALCGNCESFDSLAWATPPHVSDPVLTAAQGPVTALAAPVESAPALIEAEDTEKPAG